MERSTNSEKGPDSLGPDFLGPDSLGPEGVENHPSHCDGITTQHHHWQLFKIPVIYLTQPNPKNTPLHNIPSTNSWHFCAIKPQFLPLLGNPILLLYCPKSQLVFLLTFSRFQFNPKSILHFNVLSNQLQILLKPRKNNTKSA